MATIELFCRGCDKVKKALRLLTDPPSAIVAEVLCPDCADYLALKDPAMIYYNADGDEVIWAKDWPKRREEVIRGTTTSARRQVDRLIAIARDDLRGE